VNVLPSAARSSAARVERIYERSTQCVAVYFNRERAYSRASRSESNAKFPAQSTLGQVYKSVPSASAIV
jgi:hypothetical protein